ncbi:RluA family pseudouridine synthase [Candidatus Saccharibacteria bacterium]|nr:RluA family pseudouridine synthase [Candidatus Saccharibacteria bacterium]
MKPPKFTANHPDNKHSLMACYRMIIQYFWKRQLSWSQIEAFSGFKDEQYPWPVRSIVQLHRMGLDIKVVDTFDYKKYVTDGDDYLNNVYSQVEYDWVQNNTAPKGMLPYVGDYLRRVTQARQQPKLADIDAFLDEGRLVTVTLSGHSIDSRDGYSAHAILIYDKDGDDYLAHDPGMPPIEGRRITSKILGSWLGKHASVAGFKLDEKRGIRLDHWVSGVYPLMSRAYAAKIIANGNVTINGVVQTKAGYRLHRSDSIDIDYDATELLEIPMIELPILYEDENCLVINKPAGVLTHSVGDYTAEGTVATWLRSHCDKEQAKRKSQGRLSRGSRTGIVHRLDRATSGVMICAKSPEALGMLQGQFADRTVNKTYIAVVRGQISPEAAVIDMPIERNPKTPSTFRVGVQGKPSRTMYKTLATDGAYSLLELRPETGRTHQLRVHLAHQGHPIVGDILYGGETAERLYLHAAELQIRVPDARTSTTFSAALPDEFMDKIAV